MSNQTNAMPISGLDVIADIDRFQSAMRDEMAGFPPSPAKEMIEGAFIALVPLVAGLIRDYPVMISAFQKQREAIEEKLEQAKHNVAIAKENLAKVPPVEEIKKNITPVAPTLSPGLTAQYGSEMKGRYLVKPVITNSFHEESTAWQNWSITK